MGSFSVWHWLTAAPIFLLLLVVGVGLYFVLRKRPAGDPEPLPAQNKENPMAAVTPAARSPFRKFVSITYLVGGAIGLLMTLSQINGVPMNLASALSSLLLLAQIAAALYGGWQCWQGRGVGLQMLYWLSWSCIPVLAFPLLSYWCAMGIGIFPTLSLGAGHLGTDLTVRFGYDSSLWLFPSTHGIVLGINLMAVWFVIMIARTMKAAGIQRWPIAWPESTQPTAVR